MAKMVNLDFLCMKTAQSMAACEGKASDKENVATKGLGVLLENGPYGLMLFLETNAKEKIAKHYMKELINICNDDHIADYIEVRAPSDPKDIKDFKKVTEWLKELAKNLDGYLFVKGLWQQTLTYARYHAKALDNKDKTDETVTEEAIE